MSNSASILPEQSETIPFSVSDDLHYRLAVDLSSGLLGTVVLLPALDRLLQELGVELIDLSIEPDPATAA